MPTLGAACAVAISAAYGPIYRRLGINGIFAVALVGIRLGLVIAGVSIGRDQQEGNITASSTPQQAADIVTGPDVLIR